MPKSILATVLLCCLFTISAVFPREIPEKGTFADARDGQQYPWVQIGNLKWMAQNLNFESPGSECYDNLPENCTKFGRMYPHEDVATACPEGWRIPTPDDWKVIRKAAGKKADALIAPGEWIGKDFENANNSLGMNILPGGRKDGHGASWRETQFGEMGISASFWLDDPEFHWHIRWGKSQMHKHGPIAQQGRKFSIRCVCEAD
jgi:uncharacterized protein (TIGR02145 family)